MAQPEALYKVPATEGSIRKFVEISSSLLPYALPGLLSEVETEVTFQQTPATKINISRPTEEHLSEFEFSLAVNFDDTEGNSDLTFLISKFGELKRRNWRNRFDVDNIPTVAEGGIFAGKSPKEIAEIERGFKAEIEGWELEDELGFSTVTEGELLDLIEQLQDIDPETQLVQNG
ncbi:hypothetical protein A3F29_00630 [Candidatus Roizmanbacteria bacterium RIFCSPHIGHO2_12_FULL_33_9]|uniref:Uncharacterized protein n=1 Tax=Candidatus Roizmanbacteria bacterium RIFCSPHIGHO2_12_FULL_33_9 TaxID=1802045 RepID=A0A1F7HI86_9BACT|nr:MAG: hypothetical protein A3F29_00630 [Candidatus Roizmanbacteria bacterium RIFCSPHIGHO2_12_FULL_33_9]